MLDWWINEWRGKTSRLNKLALHWEYWANVLFANRCSDVRSVLEVGCGAYGIIHHAPGYHNVGIDPLMEELLDNFPVSAFATHISFRKGVAEHLEFKDKEFDVVVCLTVLEHLEDPVKAVAEMARVSRNWVFVSSNTYAGYWWWARWLSHKLGISSPAERQFFSDQQLTEMFRQAGLEIIEMFHGEVDGAVATGEPTPCLAGVRGIAAGFGWLEACKYGLSRIMGARAYRGDTIWVMRRM